MCETPNECRMRKTDTGIVYTYRDSSLYSIRDFFFTNEQVAKAYKLIQEKLTQEKPIFKSGQDILVVEVQKQDNVVRYKVASTRYKWVHLNNNFNNINNMSSEFLQAIIDARNS